NIDVERFSRDEEYKKSIVLSLAETTATTDGAQWNTAMEMADQYHIPRYDVIVAHHIPWLFTTYYQREHQQQQHTDDQWYKI
ncbi:hypothetical protein HMI54_011450, partial [Coelomomyces lativittatus]